MAKRSETPAPDEIEELRHEVANLKDEVRVLADILNEIHEELQWVTRNGLPLQSSRPFSPVLKQMALDPLAEDWGERLQIVRDEQKESEAERVTIKSTAPMAQSPEPVFPKSGGQGQLF